MIFAVRREKLIVIKGNCDSEVDQMISDFYFTDSVYIPLGNTTVFLTHGHVYNKDNVPRNCNALIYGHFHTAFIEKKNDIIIANPGSNGDLRVVAVSFPPTDFAGDSGPIINIDIQAQQTFEGTTQIEVKNVVMTTADAQTEISVPDFVVVVTAVKGSGHMLGDVNCDGEVTSIDITCLYNYLLYGDDTFLATSDVNGDGEITSADVTAVYSALLGNQ